MTKEEKPYIIHCELSLEQVKLLRDLLYKNEYFTYAEKGGNSKQLELAISLSMAIENGCELNTKKLMTTQEAFVDCVGLVSILAFLAFIIYILTQ